jgi:hypothetical protein
MNELTLPSAFIDPELETLDLLQVASILKKEPKTVKNLCYSNPDKVPPRIKLKGRTEFLWRKQTVLEWLRQHESQ